MNLDFSPEMARYIMSLPDRPIGYWDNAYIKAVTGFGWAHWQSIFAQAPGLEGVFRSTSTNTYLRESNRIQAIWKEAERA